MLGAYLTTAFVVGGVGAWHLLKGHWDGASQRMFSMAMWMAALVAPLQAIAGDFHGLNTLEHQPAKIAAMEGHFETHAGAPLYLFGLPDLEAETTHYAIGIPKLGSLILGHSWDAELKGLKAFPRDQWPNAPVIFWTFRLMVGIGFLMIGIGLVSLWLRWHKRLYDAQWFLRLCVLASPLGFFAVTFGWITTEHGRQPWVVYGLMRTADAVSPHPAGSVLASLVMFVVVYCVVFGAGTYYLLRLMREVPSRARPPPALARRPAADGGCRRAARARRLRAEPGGVTAMTLDLPLIWAGIIALGVIMYVIMDGFDLGVGILFPFAATDEDRDVMMNTAAPIWDGNETWLVLGGAAMLGAFPIAYAVILSAFYLPLIVMLLALIFRGVAFEFRFKSRRNRHWWDRAFAWGSMTATFAQGVVLGAFIHGIEVTDRAFQGHAFAWLTPFSLFCGLALLGGYAMLGAGWLIMKTTGDLQSWAYGRMRFVGLLVLAAIAVVSLWTPLIHAEIAARWFTWPNILYLAPVPILVGPGHHPPRHRHRPPRGARALPPHPPPLPPLLRRPRHQPLPLHHPTRHHDLGRRRPAFLPGLHAGRHRDPAADHPRLHGLQLLGVPREGDGGQRVPSLMAEGSRLSRLALVRGAVGCWRPGGRSAAYLLRQLLAAA